MAKEELHSFRDVPGVKRKIVKGILVNHSVNAFMRGLERQRYVSAAGYHGALSAWVDDTGDYRGAVHAVDVCEGNGNFQIKTGARRMAERLDAENVQRFGLTRG